MSTQTSTKKNKKKIYSDFNPLETLREFPHGVTDMVTATAQTLGQDVLSGTAEDFWGQVLGGSEKSKSKSHGDLQPGEELDLSGKNLPAGRQGKEEEKKSHVEAGIDYFSDIIHGEKRIAVEQNREMERQIQEIIVELKRLTASSKVLQAEFKHVTVDQRITKPGKYHVSFFEWVLTVIRAARIRVEDSGAWLSQFKSKKKQKQYWAMFKKHGTSFAMSNERGLATQTG